MKGNVIELGIRISSSNNSKDKAEYRIQINGKDVDFLEEIDKEDAKRVILTFAEISKLFATKLCIDTKQLS